MRNFWVCPACKSPLQITHGKYACENGHSYDVAKQGYVNLLLANKKKSKDPGDSAEMLLARQNFLGEGHYAFLLEALVTTLKDRFEGREVAIADLGCGEGFYLKGLFERSDTYECWGIDISKNAAKFAARSFREGNFAVASANDVPLPSDGFDVVLSVFAPLYAGESKRLLRDGGILLKVNPGPRHLYQLKECLYEEAAEHGAPKLPEGAKLLSEAKVSKQVTLTNTQLETLVAMTPFAWNGKREARQSLLQAERFLVDFDFLVQEISFE